MTPASIIQKIIAALNGQVTHSWAIANGCGTSRSFTDADPVTKVVVILVLVLLIAHGWPFPTL